MFLNATGFYVPAGRIDNNYFQEKNGLTDEWIYPRTGIKTRSKANENENHNSMGLAAIEMARKAAPYDITEVDLIVSACYSPYDTVATLAHLAQREYNIDGAKAVYASSACSSFVNGLEIIEGYFAMGKATKAIIVCSEHNTYYSNETDPVCGHLWGDGAVAYFVSKERVSEDEAEIKTIYTCGLGNLGKGPEGVRLRPHEDGITMPDGRDVFIHACKYMVHALEQVATANDMTIDDINYLACHQANKRIVANVARQLKFGDERFFNNIEELGNTGSASAPLVLAQNLGSIKKGETAAVTVFGGGYSCGSFLLKK